MNGLRKLTDFLALRRNTTLLLAALVLAGMGERLWLGFAPKYLETLGAGVLITGLDPVHESGFIFKGKAGRLGG